MRTATAAIITITITKKSDHMTVDGDCRKAVSFFVHTKMPGSLKPGISVFLDLKRMTADQFFALSRRAFSYQMEPMSSALYRLFFVVAFFPTMNKLLCSLFDK
ncbi:MAG: hypothetical protein IKX72_01790 [Oscillospiraceae bacterium]|nr:hypothetical protein [Oscillospiraceae bacterium]